jgi:hydroxyacylglutathione hydrolase
MIFETFKTPGIAHNSYLVASKSRGIVIDPRRDIEVYLDYARNNGISIDYIFETHRQEDFVMGSLALKNATGAKIVGSDHEIFSHCDLKLQDWEFIRIEDFKIQALHTPGHTPESICYAFYQKGKEECWALFSGDTLFIGDTGRTDLPGKDKTAKNAGIQFDVIHDKIMPLGSQTLLYPAHGAGSVCGKNIADYDASTLGYEKTYNPVFTLSKKDFIHHKVHERMPRPPYFSHMEDVNLKGGLERKVLSLPPFLTPKDFQDQSKTGVIIDTRLPEAFASAHVENSYSIWLDGLPAFAGYVASHETPIYLILKGEDDAKEALTHLERIGLDNVKGILKSFESWRDAGLEFVSAAVISPRELQQNQKKFKVIDVREVTEFEDEGHIPGATNAYVGDLAKVIDEISDDKPIVVTCGVGHRASLALSILLRAGKKSVYNLLGGMSAWGNLNLPTTKKKEESFYYSLEDSSPEAVDETLSQH